MYKFICYDLDGTLVDSGADLAAAMNAVRRHYGYPVLSVEDIVRMVGNGFRLLVERAMAGTDIPYEAAAEMARRYYSEHLVDATVLYPGVRDVLEFFHERGVVQTVLSNKPTVPSEQILSALGVREYFADVIGGDSEYALKPAPDGLLAMMQRYDVQAEECLMVGDNHTDIACARQAGVRSVFLTNGLGRRESEIADVELADIRGVMTLE